MVGAQTSKPTNYPTFTPQNLKELILTQGHRDQMFDSILINIIVGIILGLLFVGASFGIRQALLLILKHITPNYANLIAGIAQMLVLLLGASTIVFVTGVKAAVFLTLITIIGAGASLALHSSIGDLVSTAKLIMYSYYRVADVITVKGIKGKVEEITAFNTVLRTFDHDKIILNNSDVLSEMLTVHSGFPVTRISARIPIRSLHNRTDVIRLLLGVGYAYPERLQEYDDEGQEIWAPVVHYNLTTCDVYILRVYVEEAAIEPHQTNLLLAAADRLNERGIELGERIVIDGQ